ncbi:unnamed protein product [Hapterophycus canaliculatus]
MGRARFGLLVPWEGCRCLKRNFGCPPDRSGCETTNLVLEFTSRKAQSFQLFVFSGLQLRRPVRFVNGNEERGCIGFVNGSLTAVRGQNQFSVWRRDFTRPMVFLIRGGIWEGCVANEPTSDDHIGEDFSAWMYLRIFRRKETATLAVRDRRFNSTAIFSGEGVRVGGTA